jgi:putative ABC transport system substrate-binding protein
MSYTPALRRPWRMKRSRQLGSARWISRSPQHAASYLIKCLAELRFSVDPKLAGRCPMTTHFLHRRREFIALLCGVVASPKSVLAEPRRKRAVIAWLGTGSESDISHFIRTFLKGMEELGYAEGRDFEIAFRFAYGDYDRLPGLAAELVQLDPDIFLASATLQAVVVKKITTTIPIVVAALADPVALGLIASEARPGGNLTGISPYVKGLPAKNLELAREIIPGATRIGLVDDVSDPKATPQRREIETAGQALELKILAVEVRTADDIGPAYETLASEHVEVVIVEQSNMLFNARNEIAEAASMHGLPSIYGYREHVEAGGLVSYGVNLVWCFHRTAHYVDKILKGARPADLPVEFPTKLELVINLKTAKALGLKIPPALLIRADEVIE